MPSESTRDQILNNFRLGREYRNSFVEEKVRSAIAAQVRALRGGMRQAEFAALLEKNQSWISRLEDPNAEAPRISTLVYVANALDIDIDIRFRPFSELLTEIEGLSDETFAAIPSFTQEDARGLLDQSAIDEAAGATVETTSITVRNGVDETSDAPRHAIPVEQCRRKQREAKG